MSSEASRVLVVRGGWEGHEPVRATELVGELLGQAGFEVEISDSLTCFADEQAMSGPDLVVLCWTMGQISKEELAGLLEAVRSGTGILGWHGGLCDAFRSEPPYQFMTGGQWVAHPGGKIDYEVHFLPERSGDPIVTGLEDFAIHSEQYYLHVDPSNEVLATTIFAANEEAPWIEGCVMPVVWKRTFGRGRVFYCSVGHDHEDLEIPQVQELLVRGSRWAARTAHQLQGDLSRASSPAGRG